MAPSSDDHELNILCFVINLWGCQNELQAPAMISISHNLNEHIVTQPLIDRLLEAVLNYPERIPELSAQSQQQIEAALKKPEILLKSKYCGFLRRLFAASDVLPLAQTLLGYVKTQIPIAQVIKRRSHFAEVLDSQFAQVFGPAILEETRRVLRTQNGYQVNPVLSALRDYEIWATASILSQQDKSQFATELIGSLSANNYETMDLLCFKNRTEIPVDWVVLLLQQWVKKLSNEPYLRQALPTYLEHYLGLVSRLKEMLGTYLPQQEVVAQAIISRIAEAPSVLETIAKLESNEAVWAVWQEWLVHHQSLMTGTLLETMIEGLNE